MTKPDWNSNVQPRRVVKPLPQAWECRCEPDDPGDSPLRPWKRNPAYLSNCPDCWERRPS